MIAALRAALVHAGFRLVLTRLDLSTSELGLAGEGYAARAMRRAGWRVLGRRVGTPAGELDLVLSGGGVLVGVEVKTGRVPAGGTRFRPGMRLDHRTFLRQSRAIRWIAGRTRHDRWRLDLCEVLVWPTGRVQLEHHPDLPHPLDPPNPYNPAPLT